MCASGRYALMFATVFSIPPLGGANVKKFVDKMSFRLWGYRKMEWDLRQMRAYE